MILWHNPRCSKSRQALQLLQDAGADVSIRKYLEDAPTLSELTQARDALGMRAIEMMRPKEAAFKERGLTKSDDDAALLQAMAEEPKLIERPIAFKDGRAALGRPPENVLDLLD